MIFLKINAPALTILFNTASVATIEPDALRTINALAILLNTVVFAFCGLAFVLVWKGYLKDKVVYQSLLISLGSIQLGGFLSDKYFGNKNIIANIISSTILLLAFLLIKIDVKNIRSNKKRF